MGSSGRGPLRIRGARMSDYDRQKRWRERNPEKVKERQDRYNCRPEVKARRHAQYRKHNPTALGPPKPRHIIAKEWREKNFARVLFHRCKSAAKRKNLPFNLTVEDLERLIAPMTCAATGLPLEIGDTGSRSGRQPSVDQIEHRAGYTIDNVRIVAWIFNRARGNGSDEEVLEMALALISKRAIEHTN